MKPGAKALQGLADFSRPVAIIAEELRGEIIERIAHLAPHDSLGIDVDHRRQNLRDRQHGGLGRGLDRGRTRLSKTVVATARKTTASLKRRLLGDLGESEELRVFPAFFPDLRSAKRLQPRATSAFSRKTCSPSRFTCRRTSERV